MNRISLLKYSSLLTFTLAAGAASTASAAPVFYDQGGNPFAPQGCGGGGCWTNHLRVTDISGDGNLDVLFPNQSGFFSNGNAQDFKVYFGDGAGGFTDQSAAFGPLSARLRQVAVGDVDGDGDMDVYAPDSRGMGKHLFIQDAGGFTDEGDARLPGVNPHAGAARFGDFDDDGDLDIFVSDGYADGRRTAAVGHIYLNDGDGTFTDASSQVPDNWSGVDADDVDLLNVDRDYDLDIMINMHNGNNNLPVDQRR